MISANQANRLVNPTDLLVAEAFLEEKILGAISSNNFSVRISIDCLNDTSISLTDICRAAKLNGYHCSTYDGSGIYISWSLHDK